MNPLDQMEKDILSTYETIQEIESQEQYEDRVLAKKRLKGDIEEQKSYLMQKLDRYALLLNTYDVQASEKITGIASIYGVDLTTLHTGSVSPGAEVIPVRSLEKTMEVIQDQISRVQSAVNLTPEPSRGALRSVDCDMGLINGVQHLLRNLAPPTIKLTGTLDNARTHVDTMSNYFELTCQAISIMRNSSSSSKEYQAALAKARLNIRLAGSSCKNLQDIVTTIDSYLMYEQRMEDKEAATKPRANNSDDTSTPLV